MIRQLPTHEVIPHPAIVMEIATDPKELAAAQAQRAQAERNWEWSKTLTTEFWDQYRGKHVCIAGQEVFVDDKAKEAVRRAREAHPMDKGYIAFYIPLKKVPRVYAHSRSLVSMQ